MERSEGRLGGGARLGEEQQQRAEVVAVGLRGVESWWRMADDFGHCTSHGHEAASGREQPSGSVGPLERGEQPGASGTVESWLLAGSTSPAALKE